MSEILLGVLRMPHDLFWADDPVLRQQHDAIRLEAAAEIERLRSGGRHILTALFGAADRGGWSRQEIHRLADYLAKQYPWADPRIAAEAAERGGVMTYYIEDDGTMSHIGSHWEGCWRAHHDCAIAEIERLSAKNTALHATVARLTRGGAHCANERQGSCREFKAAEATDY